MSHFEYLHQYQFNKNLIEKNKFDITGYCNSYDAFNWHHFCQYIIVAI